jgi:hypothetical protein
MLWRIVLVVKEEKGVVCTTYKRVEGVGGGEFSLIGSSLGSTHPLPLLAEGWDSSFKLETERETLPSNPLHPPLSVRDFTPSLPYRLQHPEWQEVFTNRYLLHTGALLPLLLFPSRTMKLHKWCLKLSIFCIVFRAAYNLPLPNVHNLV